MKKIRCTILLIACFIALLPANASDLGIGATTFSQDTLQYGNTLIINTYVVNYDAVAYSGIIDITYELNGEENIDEKIFPDPLAGQLLTIPAHDSLPVLIHIIISPAYFLPGPDILVVWPICPDGGNPHNMLRDTIYVEDPTAIISPVNSEQQLKVYAGLNNVFINNNNPEITINRVTIYNILGQEITSLTSPGNHQQIPFNNSPAGIYFVEVRLLNGEEMVFKVLNF